MRDRVKLPPDSAYVDAVLRPRFEACYQEYFTHLLDVHKAWVVMLARQQILLRDKAITILDGLEKLAEAGPDALLPFDPGSEEVYLHVERALGKIIGAELAGNISIARTRPEPIARMISRARLLDLTMDLAALRETLLNLASTHSTTLMPGYTHLQHAQPTTFAHYVLAIHDALTRDWHRLEAALKTVNRSTLGSAALAGTSLPIDRKTVDQFLGFDGMVENTYDCVASTDFMSEPAAALAIMHNTISRVAAQFIVWHTTEFGFIEVADGHASISSLMPQKKNPSPLEYLRMKSALITGNLMAVLSTAHNTTYEDVLDVYADAGPVLWQSTDLSSRSLRLFTSLLKQMRVNAPAMASSVKESFSTATELAEMIVLRAGIDYRTAHGIVARAVAACVASGQQRLTISADDLSELVEKATSRRFSCDPAWLDRALDAWKFVEGHAGPGGPAPIVVDAMVQKRLKGLASDVESMNAVRVAVAEGHQKLEAQIALLRGASQTT